MTIQNYMNCVPTGSLIYLSFDKGMIAGASCRYDFEGLR